MTIRQRLIPLLMEYFPGRGLRTDEPPNPIAVFPAVHVDVGDVRIWDDGWEATVSIGKITHGHFNPYDQTLADDEVAARVSDEVVQFLSDLFADKVLLWKAANGSGGWQSRDDEGGHALARAESKFVWSGPIEGAAGEGSRPASR